MQCLMELFKHIDAQSPLQAAKSEPPLCTIPTEGYISPNPQISKII